MTVQRVDLTVNGHAQQMNLEPRVTLADGLRNHLGLTGTHLGCEQGVCGSCTVLLDGRPVRSCLVLAVQAEGASVRTVEGLAPDDEKLTSMQERFISGRAFQCGFCTPGLLMALTALAERDAMAAKSDVEDVVSSHICRCTGYMSIIDAACSALGLPEEERAHG